MLDLDKIDLKKEIEKLKKLSGKERGVDIKYLAHYVNLKKGKEGFEKVKTELKRLNYQLPDIEKINNMEWIPVSLVTIFFLASIKLFNWQEEDIIEMGRNVWSYSSTLRRFFIKYFLSPKKTLEMGVRNWRRFYNFGEIELVRYDKKKKLAIARLKNFKKHPFTCIYFQGVFSKVIEMATGSKNVRAKETKCMFKGDPYHEWVFEWE